MDQQVDETTQPLLVVLGIDTSGKARASRFTPADAELAVMAARLMDLRAVNVTDGQLREVATALPLGKIFATGRGFVPFVKRDLYDKLAILLDTEAEVKRPALPVTGSELAPRTEANPMGEAQSPEGSVADMWEAIRIGTTVLARSEDAEEGWYEAVVSNIAADGKELTLRWRDFPREPIFKRQRRALGLLAR